MKRHRLNRKGSKVRKKRLSGLTFNVHEADGTTKRMHFASEKELVDELVANFDGQAFWLGSERFWELPEEYQFKKYSEKKIRELARETLTYLYSTHMVSQFEHKEYEWKGKKK
jgi:hypothetical protein